MCRPQRESTTHDDITASGGTAIQVEMDVRKESDWTELVRTAVATYGKVDLLANIAGVVNMVSEDTVTGLTEDGWNYVIDTDLKGVWLGMKHVIPVMQHNGGGRIVNISSLAALRGLPNLASYSAA